MAQILIIEDDRKLLKVISLLLAECGHVVLNAETGEKAVGFLSGTKIDLVLLDMKLPGISGLEILDHIHSADPLIAVVCLTGFGSLPLAVEAMRAGANDYIQKPVDNDQLLARVERALRSRSIVKVRRAELDRCYGMERPRGPDERISWPGFPEALQAFLAKPISTEAQEGMNATSSQRWREDLLTLIMQALTGLFNLGVPAFWACARLLRVVLAAGDPSISRIQSDCESLLLREAALSGSASSTTRGLVTCLQVEVRNNPVVRVETLASIARVHPTYISHLLKRETGLTFRQWRWGTLMIQAMWPLAEGTEQVSQIAFACGYGQAAQFDRDFRRIFGLTPLGFRAIALNCRSGRMKSHL